MRAHDQRLARAWAREELLPRPDRAGRFRLVAQRPIRFTAPRADCQQLTILVHRSPAEILVDDTRALAALGYRRDDQRLPDSRISARVNASYRGPVSLPGADVAASVQLQ